MIVDELLMKLGVDADTKSVKEFTGALGKVGVVATATVTAMTAIAGASVAYFDKSIRNAKLLAKEKDNLYEITDAELKQADEYIKATAKVGRSIDSVKTKIALGLAPTITKHVNQVNRWIGANKDLITKGIQKVIEFLFRAIQVVVNSARAIDKIISSTIGWEKALYLLAVALAYVKRGMLMAFVTNPVAWVIAAIAGLLLLLDDLMVYLDGGDAAFGAFWEPCIKWIEENKQAFIDFFDTVVSIFNDIVAVLKSVWDDAYKVVSGFVDLVIGLFKFFFGLFTGDTEMVKEAWLQLWSGIGDIVMGSLGLIETALEVFWAVVGNMAEVAIDLIIASFVGIVDAWKNMFKVLGDLAAEAWAWLLSQVVDAIQAIADVLAGLIPKGADLVNKLKGVFAKVKDFITAPFRAAFKIVESLFGGILGKIGSAIAKVGEFVGVSQKAQGVSFSAGGGIGAAGVVNKTANTRYGDNNTNITVNGAKDPTATAKAVEGGMKRVIESNNQYRQGAVKL